MNSSNRYSLTLRTLTPVHIGTEDVYSPLDWCLDPKSGEVVVIDLMALIESVTEEVRGKFRAMALGSTPETPNKLAELRTLIAKHVAPKHVLYRLGAHSDFVRALRGKLSSPEGRGVDLMAQMRAKVSAGKSAVSPSRNQPNQKQAQAKHWTEVRDEPRRGGGGGGPSNARNPRGGAGGRPHEEETSLYDLHPTARNGGKIYVPGTVLKGALRSGVLHHLERAKRNTVPRELHGSRKLEGFLLQDDTTFTDRALQPGLDPFAGLYVSDLSVSSQHQALGEIVYACSSQQPDNRGTSLLVEVIPSGTELQGTITFDPSKAHTYFFKEKKKLYPDITLDLILAALHAQAEIVPFMPRSTARETQQGNGELRAVLPIGRFTGAYSKLLGVEPPRRAPWVASTVESGAKDTQPFGWVELSVTEA